jgi:AcrR family transcriptional regulator
MVIQSAPSGRAERALITRRRMVKSAYDLFCGKGYIGTTMTSVAHDAGVAEPTMYYTFGTKAALFGEAMGAAIVGFELWRPPPEEPIDIVELLPWHDWWAEFLAAPTSAEALDVFITSGVGILQRVGPLVAAMHAASSDPQARDLAALNEQRRVDTYREAIRVIAGKAGGLGNALSEASATDILVVLFSAELHQALAVGRGWGYPRCVDFFRTLLHSQLLAGAEA